MRDPGLAPERTTLAWQRTGLSAVAVGALATHSFQDRLVIAIPLAAVLAGLGVLAYRTGRRPGPTEPRRLRLLAWGMTFVAVATGAATIVG